MRVYPHDHFNSELDKIKHGEKNQSSDPEFYPVQLHGEPSLNAIQ